MPSPRARSRSQRRWRSVGARALVLAALLGVTPAAAPPIAGAQARLVNASVRTFPARPAPGDDVVVVVGVQGCPAGAVTVEIYLTTSDGTGQSATLMARAAAVTNLVRRTRAVLELPDAIEGWYGARVLCGTFRPPKTAMANTVLAVGSKPSKEARLEEGPVTAGETLTYSGNGCAGSEVEYDIRQGDGVSASFGVDGTIPVDADGTWTTDLRFPADLTPGPASVRARCVLTNGAGERVEIYYGGASKVDVEAPTADV